MMKFTIFDVACFLQLVFVIMRSILLTPVLFLPLAVLAQDETNEAIAQQADKNTEKIEALEGVVHDALTLSAGEITEFILLFGFVFGAIVALAGLFAANRVNAKVGASLDQMRKELTTAITNGLDAQTKALERQSESQTRALQEHKAELHLFIKALLEKN